MFFVFVLPIASSLLWRIGLDVGFFRVFWLRVALLRWEVVDLAAECAVVGAETLSSRSKYTITTLMKTKERRRMRNGVSRAALGLLTVSCRPGRWWRAVCWRSSSELRHAVVAGCRPDRCRPLSRIRAWTSWQSSRPADRCTCLGPDQEASACPCRPARWSWL